MTKTGRLGACLSLLALGLLSLARPAKSEPVTEDGLPPRTTYPVGKSLFYPASGQRNRSFETGLVPWDIYGVLWDEVAWQIDPSDAFHGQRSLRIVSPALRDGSKNSFFVKSNRFYAKRGQTFTFSAYMRSDQEMFPVAMNIIGHSQSGGSQRVLVGRDWRRYSVAITIPDKGRGSRKNCYQAVVNPLGKGTLWVDMLQLDEGTQAKPPKEDPVLWFGYQLEGDKAFHLPGEQVTTALFVRNGTQQPSKGSLAITVTDYFDRQVQNQVFPLTVEPGQTLSLRFTNRGGRGYYRVGMRLLPEDGSLLQKEHVNFVRARVPWEPGAPFFGLPGGRDLKALERLSEWGLHGAVRVICNGGGLMEAGEVIE